MGFVVLEWKVRWCVKCGELWKREDDNIFLRTKLAHVLSLVSTTFVLHLFYWECSHNSLSLRDYALNVQGFTTWIKSCMY